METNNNGEFRIGFKKLFGLKQLSEEYSHFGNDYVFCRITSPRNLPESMTGPMRVDGMTTIFCRGGRISIEVDLDRYELEANTLLSIGSSSIFHIRDIDWDGLDASVFVVSGEFLRNVNFDINVLNTIRYGDQRSPLMHLTPEEMATTCRYLDIIHYNNESCSDAVYVRAISRSIIAAMFYQTLSYMHRRLMVGNDNVVPDRRSHSRRAAYVEKFLQLVNEHHRSERSVAFYASKLFISPKYLSLVIKDATGRSAVEWIDRYVMLEAKNLLRFSGMSVQQIAYELNFSNQSSFGKYFKNLCGMSPTEFQRS